MRLKDILKRYDKVKINWHFTSPPGYQDDIDSVFAGNCEWNGRELISLDGDDYSLDADIIEYEEFYLDDDSELWISIIEQVDWI